MARRANGEGAVYQLKDGRWAAALDMGYARGKRRRKKFVSKSQKDVVAKLREAIKTRDQGLPQTDDRITVASFLRTWLAESVRPTVRPRTFDSYKMIVERHLIPELGRTRLQKLQPDTIQSYMNKKGKAGLSARTIQYHHAVLRAALEQAARWEQVHRNVAKLVSPPRVVRDEVVPLSPDEAQRFLETAESDGTACMFSVAMALGLRESELLGITWGDADLDAALLNIRRSLQRYGGAYHLDDVKTQKSRRTLALPEPLPDLLRQHRIRQLEERLAAGPLWEGDEWDLVFSTVTGGPLSSRTLARAFKRNLQSADLRDIRFHDLRHGAASYAIAQGVPMKNVQALLGHATIAVTSDTYAHLTDALQRDTANRIGDLLWPSKTSRS